MWSWSRVDGAMIWGYKCNVSVNRDFYSVHELGTCIQPLGWKGGGEG